MRQQYVVNIKTVIEKQVLVYGEDQTEAKSNALDALTLGLPHTVVDTRTNVEGIRLAAPQAEIVVW